MARPVPGLRRLEHARRGAPAAGAARARGRARCGGGRLRRRALGRCALLADVGASPLERMSTGIGELDRVLGGGLVPGSLVLLGGAPGIGKSTLTNMVLATSSGRAARTLYVSPARSRPSRCGCAPNASAATAGRRARWRCRCSPRRSSSGCSRCCEERRPAACVIDSVQTLALCRARRARRASVGQVREVAARLLRLAKEQGTAVILVGHVTKEGALAGPRVLEHMVDCVLAVRRRARASLPRAAGAEEPLRLDQRGGPVRDAPGRAGGGARRLRPLRRGRHVCRRAGWCWRRWRARGRCWSRCRRWSRRSELEQPRRVVSGLHRNRLALVLAILARHGGVRTGGCDVFVNVVGGVRVEEPGADLAVALAVASASPRQAPGGRPPGLLRRARPDRRAALGGSPRAAPAGGRRHGLEGVIAPPGSGPGRAEARHAARGAGARDRPTGRGAGAPRGRPRSDARRIAA